MLIPPPTIVRRKTLRVEDYEYDVIYDDPESSADAFWLETNPDGPFLPGEPALHTSDQAPDDEARQRFVVRRHSDGSESLRDVRAERRCRTHARDTVFEGLAAIRFRVSGEPSGTYTFHAEGVGVACEEHHLQGVTPSTFADQAHTFARKAWGVYIEGVWDEVNAWCEGARVSIKYFLPLATYYFDSYAAVALLDEAMTLALANDRFRVLIPDLDGQSDTVDGATPEDA